MQGRVQGMAWASHATYNIVAQMGHKIYVKDKNGLISVQQAVKTRLGGPFGFLVALSGPIYDGLGTPMFCRNGDADGKFTATRYACFLSLEAAW